MSIRDRLLRIWNSKWNPFGNFDEPIPPEWCFEKYGKVKAYLYWYFIRNPLHNFDRYWVGTGNYPAEWKVWHSRRSWNLILPFFSYKGKRVEFYIGWRPKTLDNGDMVQMLGFALRRRKDA